MTEKPRRPFISLRTLGITVGVAALLVVAFLLIAPNFLKYCSKSHQSEARINLGVIYVAQMRFHGEHGRYGTFDEIGFMLAGTSNRYTYRITGSGEPGTVLPSGVGQITPDDRIVPSGLSPDGQGFTATATANLDDDPAIDRWHLNDAKQNLFIPDVNDLTETHAHEGDC